MDKIKLLYILFLLFLNFSCKDKSQKELIRSGNILNLIINDDNLINNTDGNKYFSFEKIIKLETTDSSLLNSQLEKVIFYKNKIYVLDSFIGKGVYIFDIDGEYENRIVEEQDGPLQLTMIKDFTIDPKNEEIQLLDMKAQKIFKFSLDGDFKSTINTPLDAFKFELLDSNYFFHPVKNSDYESGYYFNTWSPESNELKGHFPYIDNRNGQFSLSHKISTYKELVIFWEPFNDTIYQVGINEEEVKYYIDFGNKKIDKSVWGMDLTHKVAYVEGITNDKCLFINNVINTDKFMYFNFLSDNGCLNVFYDHRTKETSISKNIALLDQKNFNKLTSLANDDYIYTIVTEEDNNQNLVSVEPGENPAVVLFKLK